ncbi:hypothetical protein D3C76_1492510 [compost metagenome]
MQLRRDSTGIHRDYTRLYHSSERNFLGHLGVGAGGIHHSEDLISVIHGADGRESHTNTGDGAGDDELLLARGFHGTDEIRVVPRIDLTLARHVLGVWRIFMNLGDQRAVRALWNGGRGDDRNIGQRRHLGQRRSAQT